MKDYPRIRRLSTLGIIRHQHFDYEFGPFRTDFVGEGGAGKSMISDLLQLIFVGVRYFHSPTKGSGPREAKTLVLRSEGKGTDMGYAFLSLELKKNQYVIVGIYLESSGAAEMFIVQQGNNFEADTKLATFGQLLGVAEFQRDNSILPINELRDHIIDNFNLTCESWERTQTYHKILFNNDILPLDLSVSNQALHNYARIVQAFSRESLDMDKSVSLQSFLFGDEKEKEFYNRFETTVEELQGDEKQFQDNVAEIDKLKIKQQKLSDLLDLKVLKERLFKDYIEAEYDFLGQQQDGLFKELEELILKYEESTRLLPLLESVLLKKMEEIAQEQPVIEKRVEDALVLTKEWTDKRKKRGDFLRWLDELEISAEQVLAKYDSYQESKDNIRKINELEAQIQKNKISTNLLANYSGKAVLVQIQHSCDLLQQEIEFKNKLRSLNNLDEATSIARWALETDSVLNQRQEGIIRMFQNQDIRVDQPQDKLYRYLPSPEILIHGEIPVYSEDELGFWLNLNGVLEFISKDFEPVFNTGNKDDIKKYFEVQTSNIAKDIQGLEKSLADLSVLYRILEELGDADEYVKAWGAKWELDVQLQSHELFALKKDELVDHFNLANDSEVPAKAMQYENSYKTLKKEESELITLSSNLSQLEKSFIDAISDEQVVGIKSKWRFDSAEQPTVLNDLVDASDNAKFYDDFFGIYKNQEKNYAGSERIKELDRLINELKSKRNDAYGKCPEIFVSTYVPKIRQYEEVEQLREDCSAAENKYIVKYNVIAGENLNNNFKRFEDSGDFQALCAEILPPEILSDENILEKDVIEKIGKYLADINLKNKKLNSRKLNKLASIIEDVWLEVSTQLNIARQIRNFLNDDEKIISGGHKATLAEIKDNSLSADWMQIFVEKIKKDAEFGSDETLFEQEKGITNELEKYHSLTDKLQQAYYRSGGDRNLRPKIKDLLNPKSYYGLKFSMVNSSGKKNDGSNSQTYSAIALLCIAKLALLDKKSGSKDKDAIRFMAIDEAAGLGKNFDMLYKIAEANDYQIISMSISPHKIDAAKQNIYLLHNSVEDDEVNYDPVPIFGLLENGTV
ncbi:DNA repair protein Rad50 [Chryseobacterium cheonjiense]|uniref:DNA repair protein Rad50 n=1 Tax=Chryseobacterium cheonjiense TaxID=2728845 RepID=A0A7Y0A9P1_9FLAO|nr:DNA repair protein Rad50 [Chryseobacterium cheonjiense]NML59255.1 DNA repair protein Rad50 [Chryseobacterium cheonjiense]